MASSPSLLLLLLSLQGSCAFFGQPPPWCEELIEAQRNATCATPFTSIPQSRKVPLTLPRDEYISRVAAASTKHMDRASVWMSGQGQDWWVWYNHARFLSKRGVYVDLAANDAIWRSNTYFFDVCMRWHGLLIEPNRVHHSLYARERSGVLVPVCVSSSTKNVSFAFGLGWRGGSSRVVETASGGDEGGTVSTIQCRPLSTIFAEHAVRHVDVLSLDIEGHEVEGLSNYDSLPTTQSRLTSS
jgi:FkbM family methyltransferase